MTAATTVAAAAAAGRRGNLNRTGKAVTGVEKLCGGVHSIVQSQWEPTLDTAAAAPRHQPATRMLRHTRRLPYYDRQALLRRVYHSL